VWSRRDSDGTPRPVDDRPVRSWDLGRIRVGLVPPEAPRTGLSFNRRPTHFGESGLVSRMGAFGQRPALTSRWEPLQRGPRAARGPSGGRTGASLRSTSALKASARSEPSPCNRLLGHPGNIAGTRGRSARVLPTVVLSSPQAPGCRQGPLPEPGRSVLNSEAVGADPVSATRQELSHATTLDGCLSGKAVVRPFGPWPLLPRNCSSAVDDLRRLQPSAVDLS
jgi:hypothetical protein